MKNNKQEKELGNNPTIKELSEAWTKHHAKEIEENNTD